LQSVEITLKTTDDRGLSLRATSMDTSAIIDNISRTYIDKSPIHGFGLFAETFISEKTELCLLDGQIVPWDVYKDNQDVIEWNALPGEILLLRPWRTKYSLINHSRAPNLKVLSENDGGMRLRVVAIKDIQANEELLLDYRDEPLPAGYVSGHGATYL
jgi:hypothetical protein